MARDLSVTNDDSIIFLVIVNPELDENVGDLIDHGSISIDDIRVRFHPKDSGLPSSINATTNSFVCFVDLQ